MSDVSGLLPPGVPDREFYTPIFSPWLGLGEFGPLYDKVRPYTVVTADRCWVLYTLARQALHIPGNVYDAGVYRGGTAILLREVLKQSSGDKVLRLFDTFIGMPETDFELDMHATGDFSDTSLAEVRARVGDDAFIAYYQGVMPDTFSGLEDDLICLAHVDVDIYRSILDCSAFIYPRLSPGGFMIFDDYGFPTCPGARAAVDEFFIDKPEVPLILPTGQALVSKCPAPE